MLSIRNAGCPTDLVLSCLVGSCAGHKLHRTTVDATGTGNPASNTIPVVLVDTDCLAGAGGSTETSRRETIPKRESEPRPCLYPDL